MTKTATSLDRRQIIHGKLGGKKETVRLLYGDVHRVPFSDGLFSGVLMLDVLHHLERPIEFLNETARVLKPGGHLAMIEPAMTTVARRFYDHFHEEPVDMGAEPFPRVAATPHGDR